MPGLNRWMWTTARKAGHSRLCVFRCASRGRIGTRKVLGHAEHGWRHWPLAIHNDFAIEPTNGRSFVHL